LDPEAAEWREQIVLGRYCRVPPWYMDDVPLVWLDRLRLSMDLDARMQRYQERLAELEAGR
jgi:hypothetical protein